MAEKGSRVSAGVPIMGTSENETQQFVRVSPEGALAVDTEQFTTFDECMRWAVGNTDTSVTLAPANPDRRYLTIRNTAGTLLHVCPGSADATALSAVKTLAQNESWDAPIGYRGPVQGMWMSNTNDGSAVVAEYR